MRFGLKLAAAKKRAHDEDEDYVIGSHLRSARRRAKRRRRSSAVTTSGSDMDVDMVPTIARLGDAAAGYMAGAVAAGVGTAALGPEVAAPATLWGGVAGAIAGYNSRSASFQNKNMGMSVGNQHVDKSAMNQKGKAKVKKVRPVKVSPYLRKAVKQVVSGLSASGLYKRTFSGMVGCSVVDASADKEFPATIMGTSQVAAYVPGTKKSVGGRTWFNSLCLSQETDDLAPFTDNDMNFFTPTKIWHAASVLFNNKSESANPYATTTGNLSTTFTTATGDQVITPQNLKIEVKSSYVNFTLRNMSVRNVYVDIYECVPQNRFMTGNPLNDLVNIAKNMQDDSTANATTKSDIVGIYENGFVQNNTAGWITDGVTEVPAIAKKNGWKWKYVKKTMMLAPGENCVHVMKGPSGVLDYQKCYDPNSDSFTVNCGWKDWSKHVMISCRAEFAFRTNAGVVTSHSARRWVPMTATKAVLSSLVAVECTEVLKIVVPEVAGFVYNTAKAAGSAQTLNLRRRRIQLTSLIDNTSGTTSVSVNNEVNPAAAVTSTLYS